MSNNDNDNVIYSYTSVQAIEDGVLAPLEGPHLVTTALLAQQPGSYESRDVSHLKKVLAQLLKMAEANSRETLFTRGLTNADGEPIWAGRNELGGWTLMLPSDY